MNQYKKGDRFETLKKGQDTSGKKVPKGSIVLMYEMSLGCSKEDTFYLNIKGVTTKGQMIEWPLSDRYLRKMAIGEEE